MLAQYDYWWIWCLFLVVGFGGCIGSFINVVIYRLPQGIRLGRPRWSFCPNCKTSLKWHDNIPVISYFVLRGHCRTCACPIPPRYVVVEILTLLIFLILFDAFFVASVLDGVIADRWSVSYRFYCDWPIYTAHVLLFSCLLAMSVVDMQHYWLDIRFTHFAALCGFFFHGIWTPARTPPWPRPEMTLSAACILATVAAVVTHGVMVWIWHRRARGTEEDQEPTRQSDPEREQPTSVPIHLGKKSLRFSAWFSGLVIVVVLAMLVAALLEKPSEATASLQSKGQVQTRSAHRAPDEAFMRRVGPSLVFVFCALIAGSVVKRDSDEQIEEALEAEKHNARKVVLVELATLLPTIALFVAGVLLVRADGALHELWQSLWNWEIGAQTRPFVGLGTAAAGFVIGGAVGWVVRIFFTLALGKEAFGAGDIHIMAAAGAVLGWEVVVVGFFLSAVLALVGKALTLPFKRGHALPMGPWLSLAMFLVVLWRGPVIANLINRFAMALSTLTSGAV